MKTTRNIFLAALLLGIAHTASARTLFWGGPVWGEHVESDSTTHLLDAGFTFQIGAFNDGFNPAVAPLTSWAANWHVFDESDYSDTNMYFDSKADLSATGTSNGTNADSTFNFFGKKLYIWVYDVNTFQSSSPTVVEEVCHEWALISGSAWTLPTDGGDQTTLPLEWRLDNATQAWVGAVDIDGNGTGEIRGTIGTYTDPSGAFDLQTHTVCALVPEPSSTLLILLSSAFLVRRKRSDRSA